MARYSGKTVVVIGGTSGIGLASARRLQDEGATILVTGRTESNIQAAREALGDAIVVRSDLASIDDIRSLPSVVSESFGRIDLLLISGGINVGGPLEATTESDYDAAFDINMKGPYFVVQSLAPQIKDGGAIVLVTSVANRKGLQGTSVYAATKAALRSLVRTIAREMLPRNIRVNAVSPGPIDTPILLRSLGKEKAEEMRAFFRKTNPMARMGDPDEVAKAVAFLGFEASFTTGAELPVDGGASQI